MIGKMTVAALVCASLMLLIGLVLFSDTTEVMTATEPMLHVEPIDTADITAESFVVFDVVTGEELASHNEEEERPIASVTKLFSAATVLEQGELEATTTITWGDVNTEGRAGKLKAYDEYSQRELLWPLLLESSNDAAAALERVEPELVAKMNELVLTSGAEHTHFSDASGLSPANTSTAKEVARLTRELFYRLPHLFDITRLPQYIGQETGWVNNNPVVQEEGYRGGKHGFTYEANRTGTVVFEEPLKTGGTRLLGYVVLGSDDLASDIEKLRTRMHEAVYLR